MSGTSGVAGKTPGTIGLDERLRTRQGLLAQRAADSRVVLDPATGQYYALDEVSGRVWDLCDGSRSVAQVVAALCEEYDASHEEIQADVLALLAELAGDGLVVREG